MKSVNMIVFMRMFLLCFCVRGSLERRMWVTTDELENHISPEDLREFFHFYQNGTTTAQPETSAEYADFEASTRGPVPDLVDCFGLGSISRLVLSYFNMKPDDSNTINTHFYFSSRLKPKRVQVYPGNQFGLEHTDYKPTRKTVMIVHGFMSYSNASWVLDMTRAFLEWGDVNVIAVDWSGGGNTWKYWRAVANTRRVGHDITTFMNQLIQASGARVKDFHFIGHSLGAHISSYASYHLGRVARITGLDPAQPCFVTTNDVERLDSTDADFVDIIHTNARLLQMVGFGMPDPMGHVDFYPNGGLKQPGCFNGTRSFWSRMTRMLPFSPAKLQQAVCSHGRAYVLFTESLINNNCSFRAYRWDLSYEGVNASLNSTCDRGGSCAEMGISALTSPQARGPYFLLTTEKEPYCVFLMMANSISGFQWKTRFIYFGRNCGIHGLNHLFRKDAIFLARLLWLSIMVASAFCLYLLLVPVIELDGGIQFTPDTLYLNWTTTFPGVTVCEELYPKGVTKSLEQRHPELMQPLSYDQKRYIVELLYGRGKCSPARCFPCGQAIGCDVPWRKIVDDAHKKCEELITDCSYMGEEFSCCKIFLLVDSEYGPCYSFNTLQNAQCIKEKLFTTNSTVGPGELTFRLIADATISIHSTEELSTNNLEADYKMIVPISQGVDILLSVLEMENDPVVEKVDIAERKCRLLHEVPYDMFHTYPVYSYGACKLARSTEHAYEHCKCVAPQRDLSYEKYYCNYTGMNCLAKHEAEMKLGIEKAHEDEYCLPSCIESEILIIHDHRMKLTTPEERSKGAVINIKMSSLPTLRYRRGLTSTNLDIVVSVGGMAGLFFSASVLSFVEIFYLLLRKPAKPTE